MSFAESSNYFFKQAAKLLELSEDTITLLSQPYRELHVQVPIKMQNNKTKVFQGSHPESIQKSMISLKQRFEKELKKYEN